jgi:hypothetical protein
VRLEQAVEQQRRKQHVVDQLLQPVPEVVAQMQDAAQAGAEQDQGKVGKECEGERGVDGHCP